MNTVAKQWAKWLAKEYDTCYYPPTKCTVYGLIEILFRNRILPHFEACGYIFNGTHQAVINAILNFIFRFEVDYIHNRPTWYKSNITYKGKCTIDDREFYINTKCPVEIWDNIKKEFRIKHFTDDSEFSIRLWIELPLFLFSLINLEKSSATQELAELLKWDDEQEEKDDLRKKDIDPYLLDYGGARYRQMLNE